MGVNLSLPLDFKVPAYYPGAPYILPPHLSRPNYCAINAPQDGGDVGPLIERALNNECRTNARVILPDKAYNVGSVISTTRLENVEVHIKGNMTWSTDGNYWTKNSLKVGYQNQSTAWEFGGTNVWLHGTDDAVLNGNGQYWYDNYGPINNYAGRPHAITFRGLNNSVVENLQFWQSQMWTMSIIFSNNLLLRDIKINNTNTNPMGNYDHSSNQNTDGADTIFSNNVTFARWSVDCGDDSISGKANSTNILVEDCDFYKGLGIALGSIGQYDKQWSQITNFTARKVRYHGTRQGAYIKTWTGVSMDSPPNGGGGGLGQVKNITFDDWTFDNVGTAFQATQAVAYLPWNAGKNVDTSLLQISDLNWGNIRGTTTSDQICDLRCSGAAPCKNVTMHDIDLTHNGNKVDKYSCKNVDTASAKGFICS